MQEAYASANSKVYDKFGISENESSIGLVDSDIASHTHRMYLIGENSIHFPWFIPKDFPCKALGPDLQESFFKLVQTQDYLDWTSCQKIAYLLTRIFFPPLANQVHRSFRRRHFEQLRTTFTATFPLE